MRSQREQLESLRDRGRAIIENWEHGDLAQAVNNLRVELELQEAEEQEKL